MNKIAPVLFLLLLAAAQTAASGNDAVNIPPSTSVTLDNGLKVVMMEYHRLPIVEMRLTIGGGTSLDPDSLTGLAGMTAELLRQGTATRTATQIAEQVDFIGATLGTGADDDFFSISTEFLTKDMETGLGLFADVVLNPTFPREEIDRSRSQRLAGLEQAKENPRAIAAVAFAKAVYGNHPYGRQSDGTAASLPRITRDALTAFYRSTFLPNNSLLVAVGDFRPEDMLARIKGAFGGWKPGAMPALPSAKPEFHTGRRVVVVDKPDATQTQIRIGNTGIGILNPDRIAITVANTILGGGFTSRLVDRIRVKNSLTYNIGSSFSAGRIGGSYLISTFTKNQTVRKTIDLTLAEVKKIRDDGVTAEELSKAKNYIAGSYARSLQAPDDLAERLSMSIFYGFPDDYLRTYVSRVNSVTSDDVLRVLRKYFEYDNLVFVLVTNPGETKSQLDGLGPITEITLEKAIE